MPKVPESLRSTFFYMKSAVNELLEMKQVLIVIKPVLEAQVMFESPATKKRDFTS